MDYKKLYFHLFNAATDSIEHINNGDWVAARDILIRAQQETEEMYLEEGFDDFLSKPIKKPSTAASTKSNASHNS